MSKQLERMGLEFNPFEPAASGAPVDKLWLPSSWGSEIKRLLDLLEQGRGVKALALTGEYGSGKTYILQWLCRYAFPEMRIRPFYFDNPGIQFYELANMLLRQIGRKDFAKFIWELASPHVQGYQRSLFTHENGFEEYVRAQQNRRLKVDIVPDLKEAVQKAGITTDDEIAYRLGQIVAETPKKPYFEYRDFVAGGHDAYVAEGEETRYFGAILKTLRLGAGIDAVAFIIDEFEELSLEKSLTRRQAHDYLVTLRRLIDLTQEEDLWVVISMTREGIEKAKALQPALWERFTNQGKYQFDIPRLKVTDATGLVKARLNSARPEDSPHLDSLFPFPDDLGDALSPAIIQSPRRLVKVCFYAISDAGKTALPFTAEYLHKIEGNVYSAASGGG